MSEQKVAIVTGAGAGIGRAIAIKLAKEGYKVAANGRQEGNTLETVELIRKNGGESFGVVADVSSKSEVDQMVKKVIDKYGRIDLLVNNAGVCPIRDLSEVTNESFENTIQTNLFSMFYCAKAVSNHMIAQRSGRIINAGSQSSFRQSGQTVEYATSKWAVRGLTRTLAAALAPYNITVNAYCPGTVITPMQLGVAERRGGAKGQTVEEFYKERFKEIPLGRDQPVEEVAELVYFLASDAGNNITGQNIMINGGQVMC